MGVALRQAWSSISERGCRRRTYYVLALGEQRRVKFGVLGLELAQLLLLAHSHTVFSTVVSTAPARAGDRTPRRGCVSADAVAGAMWARASVKIQSAACAHRAHRPPRA